MRKVVCVRARLFSEVWWVGLLRRASKSGYFIRLQDFWIFIVGAKTDAWVARLRADVGDRTAFETIYHESDDPWCSNSPRYNYQRRKYHVLMSFLPADRRYQHTLDLGCGLGTLSGLLADRSDQVLGLDVAQTAIDRAHKAHVASNVDFERMDILDLPDRLNGQFDLIMIVDTLYYLSSTSDELLRELAVRIADLLAADGLCVLTNHFFFPWDKETRLSRRIHRAFVNSPRFHFISEHWRPFYLTTMLSLTAPIGVRTPDVRL
jgi:SAM-dependent methyltransferase